MADSKRVLERSIDSEKQKNKVLMSKLQQQILGILEAERRSMRGQFIKQSKAVNSLIETIEYDDDDDDDDDYDDSSFSEDNGYDYI